ncbi:MAG TPA: hypothetical protein VE990_12435 [Acidimicrobiales bacterium]|nr:hypothetical protein [Acidimicrobiales bacterium]
MSRQRSKGTRWETELLNRLAWAFPNHVITRAGTTLGANDEGDFVGGPFPLEAKSTKTLCIPLWVRKLRAKAVTHRWALLWHGDRRTADGQGLMVVDVEFGLELLRSWELVNHAG